MATYTIWNNTIPSGTSQTATGARTDGILFTVSQASQLTSIAFYVPAGETTLTGSSYTGLLWSTTTGISGTLLGSQAGTGTWVAGAWNWITLSTPITLSPGVDYVAGISSPDQIQYEHNYWGAGDPGAGGLTSGPINVPSATTAPNNNQQGNAGAANAFPASSTTSWYGVDIQVSTTFVVQTATSGNLSNTAAFTNPVTPGNTVVIIAAAYNSGGGGSGMSSSSPTLGGSTPPSSALLKSTFSPGSDAIYESAWLLPAIATVPGDGKTLSISFSGNSGSVSLFGFEIAGLGPTPTLDQFSTNSATFNASVSCGPTGGIRYSPEFILGGASYYATTAASGPSGWSGISTTNQFSWAGYQIASASGGTYSWSQTIGINNDWSAVIVALSGTAASTPSPSLLMVGLI